ncbi:MAG: methyl-accepting chemotaxis protein [Gammaproteobacteria bacterium]
MKKGPIEIKTLSTFAVIAAVMVCASSVTLFSLKNSEDDTEMINALGRQRMLTQAMAKAALSDAWGHYETRLSDAGSASPKSSGSVPNEFDSAKEIFEMTLKAAKNGGSYPFDLTLQKMGHLEKIEDGPSQAKVVEIENGFIDFKRSVDALMHADPSSATLRNAIEDVIKQSNQLRKSSNDLVTLYAAVADRNNSRIRNSTIVMLLVNLTILTGAALFIKKSVLNRISTTLARLQDIARGDGDLTRRLNDSSNDELGMLAEAFDEFVAKIHGLVGNVAAAATRLGKSAKNIAEVAGKTSEAVYRQQSETEQLATAITEMSATVADVAKSAANAESKAQQVDQSVSSGRGTVDSSVQGILELSREVDQATDVLNTLASESDGIGTVLDVIRGIAEQTNLLALNAAIEAARAGEQGRGFAVVADEVRTLASRTQASTQEIQAMIERLQSNAKKAVAVMNDSKSKVEQNVKQSRAAGEVFNAITEAVAAISSMNAQIACATEQQSATTEEINRSVINIIGEAETSADYVRMADKAAEELSRITDELKKLIGQFHIST